MYALFVFPYFPVPAGLFRPMYSESLRVPTPVYLIASATCGRVRLSLMPASAGRIVSLHFFVPRQDGAYSIVSVPAAPIISCAAVHSLPPSHRPLRLPFPLRRKALRISWGLASPFRLLRLVHYLLRLRYLCQLATLRGVYAIGVACAYRPSPVAFPAPAVF